MCCFFHCFAQLGENRQQQCFIISQIAVCSVSWNTPHQTGVGIQAQHFDLGVFIEFFPHTSVSAWQVFFPHVTSSNSSE